MLTAVLRYVYLYLTVARAVWVCEAAWWNCVIAKELVDDRMKAVIDSGAVKKKCSGDGVYLTYLLSNDNISRDEIYSNVMEMLFAATDTVCCIQLRATPYENLYFTMNGSKISLQGFDAVGWAAGRASGL